MKFWYRWQMRAYPVPVVLPPFRGGYRVPVPMRRAKRKKMGAGHNPQDWVCWVIIAYFLPDLASLISSQRGFFYGW